MGKLSDDRLTPEESGVLLSIARMAIEAEILGTPFQPLNVESYTATLQENGTTFVTLTIDGQLRGCVGALEPRQPLVEDVREHAIAAATQDYRFPRVTPAELDEISIEISRLTTPKPLKYIDSHDLIKQLRPGIDGVVLKDGLRRATFLPQVWDKIPSPVDFLNHLCAKMGVSGNYWQNVKLDVLIYQVQEFHE